MTHVISDKRKASARKHASRSRTCVCGKICRGNGGWSSHKRACEQWQAAKARWTAQQWREIHPALDWLPEIAEER